MDVAPTPYIYFDPFIDLFGLDRAMGILLGCTVREGR